LSTAFWTDAWSRSRATASSRLNNFSRSWTKTWLFYSGGAINFDDKLVWFLTASYAGEEHLTKGHRSNKPLYLTEAEISRLQQLKSLTPNATENDLVFADPKHPDRPMTEQNALRCRLKKAAEKIGTHLTWHQLRHWSGTMLYRAGVPINVIQARLGHSRWQTTADWYIESDREGEREAANVASRLLEAGREGRTIHPKLLAQLFAAASETADRRFRL